MWKSEKIKIDTCPKEPIDCIKCSDFIYGRCVGKEQREAPKGWIKLKSIVNSDDNTLYIKASKIVGVGHSANADNISGRVVTAVWTQYAEDDPWLVYDSINEVMEKIGRAQNEID